MTETGRQPDRNDKRKKHAADELQNFLRTVGNKGSYRRFTLIVDEQDGVLQRNVKSLTETGP